jgi:plastocyanin
MGAGTTGLRKKPRFQLIAYSIQGASARTEPQAHASSTKRQVSGKDFSFKLSSKSIAKPGRVAFNFNNVGHLADNFKVNGKHTPDVQPAKTAKLVVNFKKKGKYRYICTEPGHAAAGMKGVFTIRYHEASAASVPPGQRPRARPEPHAARAGRGRARARRGRPAQP